MGSQRILGDGWACVRAAVSLVLSFLLVFLITGPASADHNPHHHEDPDEELMSDWGGIPPLLDQEALITDDMEAQVVAAESCSYQPLLSGPPTGSPSDPSFMMVHVVPSGWTASNKLDRSRDCTDGSFRRSSLGRSARNLAVWHDLENADMEYRFHTITRTHLYTVRPTAIGGFVATFHPGRKPSGTLSRYTIPIATTEQGSGRAQVLRNDMDEDGWLDVADFKYVTLLISDAQLESCSGGTCTWTWGSALRGGRVSLASRFREDNVGNRKTFRYGCATLGDQVVGHEATHLLNVGHFNDETHDLMNEAWGGRTYKSSPRIDWDIDRDDYQDYVHEKDYVIKSEYGSTTLSKCDGGNPS